MREPGLWASAPSEWSKWRIEVKLETRGVTIAIDGNVLPNVVTNPADVLILATLALKLSSTNGAPRPPPAGPAPEVVWFDDVRLSVAP